MGSARSAVETKRQGGRRTSEPSGDGRQRILDEAARRFLESGYVETSLRDVASGAGMKAGSLYYHFESKEALLIAILERGMICMVEAFEAAARRLHNDGGPGAGAPPSGPDHDHEIAFAHLTDHVAAHLRALHGNRPYTAAHVTLFRTAPESVRRAVVPLRDDYERQWTELLASLLPSRDRKEISMLRLALFGAMNASVEWLDAERGNIDEFAALVADQFWYGVADQRSLAGHNHRAQ